MILLFSMIFSLALLQNVFSQEEETSSVEVMSLKEIDSLIKQTEYDSAIKALSAYIKQYPKALDAAQKRIDKIRKARAYYVQLSNKLLDVMEKEPENDEKKLAIIKELETLERHPSAEHLAFIKQAKIAAEFTYYRAQYNRILEEAVARTMDKKYSDAITLIEGGFYMYHDEFYEENPPSVTNSITSNLAELNDLNRSYENIRSNWQSAYNSFIQAIKSGNYENAATAWNNFNSQMKRFAGLRNSVAQKGVFFNNLFARQKEQNPDTGEVSYLSFMSHFILGSESIEHSGIIGTMDADWAFMTEGAKREIDLVIAEKLSDFVKSNSVERDLQNKSISEIALLQSADSFANLALDVNNLYSLLILPDGKYNSDVCPTYVRSINYARSIIAGTNPSFENYSEFKVLGDELQSVVASKTSAKDITQADIDMEHIYDLVLKIGEKKDFASENLNAEWYTSYNSDFVPTDTKKENSKNIDKAAAFAKKDSLHDWREQSKFFVEVNMLTYNESNVAIGTVWKDFADYYAGLAREIQSNYEGVFDIAETLSVGIDEDTPEENNPENLTPGRYPTQAIQDISKKQPSVEEDLKKLVQIQKGFSLVPKGENKEQRQDIEKAVAALESHNEQGTKIKVVSEEEVRLAESERDRADEYYNSALADYRRENFAASRENIQRAREHYNESLSHQESAELRASSDKKLADLGKQINEAENRIIVGEVRVLKTRAKGEYYAGNFESAENLLNRAESRWAVTNVEEDEEIRNLKAIVQNALAMKTGREIKPTAPLYPEMSQILSNAHQYYDRGEALIKQGKRAEAVEVLNNAKKKLQELQMVYPLNQEASLLTLRIDNLIDPMQFNASFSRRVETARNNVKVPATQQSAYSDLLDLYQIRPNYPGLRDLIYNVEIDLGIRARPIDKSGLEKSTKLTQEAQRLYDSAAGNEAILRQALSRLDQAISLNPENERAIILKDRIQIAVGGKAAVVLSSADEADYNRAIQELRNNNIMGAYTIVQQLMQNPSNRRSTKILDLQKQIQARL